ncbi:MAG: SPOR domain-containing protein [Bacteroidales bacterium]|nr:SPOR domain-containing protein [Bacteroidales bacterium]
MKKVLTVILALATAGLGLRAQDVVVPSGYNLVDSLVFRPAATQDSTLSGKSIFSILPKKSKGDKADVNIRQSQAIQSAMTKTFAGNSSRSITGYRVRIFFDNKQNSRGASEAAAGRFKGMYPGMAVYRTYSNPFFKVTVGDFRTRSEALQLLNAIKSEFPSSFVVREKINYPIVDKRRSYVADTVLVMRPVEQKN